MIYGYFEKTPLDEKIYSEKIKDRLPVYILDVHTHINKPEHIKEVPPERLANDWAFQCGTVMTAEDARYYFNAFYPDKKTGLCGFPMPIKEADIEGNNEYISECVKNGDIAYGLMCVKPEYSLEYLQRELTAKPFSGVKPYPDMVSGAKGAEIGILEFMPHRQLALFEKLNKSVMLHLPRAGRMPDGDNIRELKEIRDKYPDLKICIAHFGRCFTPYYFKAAIEKMGDYINTFYFDTAAVMNIQVHGLALEMLPHDKIMYGSDLPIFLWHGRRRWTEKGYFNLCREDFPWNRHEDRENEAGYTFYIYEQINNLLDAMERLNLDQKTKEKIFFQNAKEFLKG